MPGAAFSELDFASRLATVLRKHFPGLFNVFTDLVGQLLGAGECLFIPQPFNETHLDNLPINIFIEVYDVGFHREGSI